MISRKYRNVYYNKFLPLMECIFQYRTSKGQDLVVNETNLSIYFDVNRTTISSFLKEMEDTKLVKYVGSKRIFDEFATQWSMRCYSLVPTDTKYCSKLQEFINNYMLWEPYLTDRLDFIICYTDDIYEKKLKIAKEKLESGQKLTKEEKKMLKKYEQNLAYQNEYTWAIDLLDIINSQRPEAFKSKYLKEGRNRETNVICGTYNPDKEHVNASEEELSERNILLSTFFETDKFEEFDTNASIYRLSYALSMKHPLKHDIDVYEAIWKKAYYNVEFSKLIRDSLKILCMPIYMSNGKKNAWNALVADKTGTMTKSELARKSALNYLSSVTKQDARTIMDDLAAAMRKFIGTADFLEEEIFIFESNLHILMITEFANRGIKTINVYDGFYFKKGTCSQELFDQVYDLCTRKLLEKCSCY